MTASKPRALLALTSVCLLGATVSGCTTSPPGDNSDSNDSVSATTSPKETLVNSDDQAEILETQQTLLEEQLPEITGALGATRVERLRQTTCNGRHDPSKMNEIVQWTTSTGVNVADLDEARAVASKAEPYLKEHGWKVTHRDDLDPEAPLNEIYAAKHAETGIGLRALYDHGGGDSVLFLDGGGPCVETPEGYQMLRSHLDLGFGDGTPEYDSEAERRSPNYTEEPAHPNPGPATQQPGPATDG